MMCAEEEQIKQEVTALVEAWGMKYSGHHLPAVCFCNILPGTAATAFVLTWAG